MRYAKTHQKSNLSPVEASQQEGTGENFDGEIQGVLDEVYDESEQSLDMQEITVGEMVNREVEGDDDVEGL